MVGFHKSGHIFFKSDYYVRIHLYLVIATRKAFVETNMYSYRTVSNTGKENFDNLKFFYRE